MKIRRISALKISSECFDINEGGTAGFRSLGDWSSVRPSFFDTYFQEAIMAEKKMVEAITAMEEDFAQWYTDVVKKAELIDYTSVKGCMVFKPAGYAIW